jgi:hypothetical protein
MAHRRKYPKEAIVFQYIPLHDLELNINYYPLIKIRLKHHNRSFQTLALIDSGATYSMIPLEFIEILGIELPSITAQALGANGPFMLYNVILELLECYSEDVIFCIFENISVKIPTNPNTLPFIVLGRDSLFKRYEITFRENENELILVP